MLDHLQYQLLENGEVIRFGQTDPGTTQLSLEDVPRASNLVFRIRAVYTNRRTSPWLYNSFDVARVQIILITPTDGAVFDSETSVHFSSQVDAAEETVLRVEYWAERIS